MKLTVVLFALPICLLAQSNSKKIKVLFLGNSYTYVNNLPQMIADMAAAGGDTLLFDSNCIGGYTFGNHCSDQTSKSKIALGNWDYVVLQAQSQEPSFSPAQVNSQTLPYAIKLDSLVKAANPCTRTVFYETWGRKYGDAGNCANYPPVCTYTGMQGRLKESYLLFADTCKALVAPVGEAWRSSISTAPTLELYQSDQSHPSIEGSYLAAAVFYKVLFAKSVLSTTYSAALSSSVASHLLGAANTTVQDSLSLWNIGKYYPDATFSGVLNGNSYQYLADNSNFFHVFNFGDGASTTQIMGLHTYTANGQYTISHTVNNACGSDTKMQTILVTGLADIKSNEIAELKIPTTFNDVLTLNVPEASEYVIRIVDLQGRELFTGRASSAINTSAFAVGIYVLEISDKQQKQRYRLIKYAQ